MLTQHLLYPQQHPFTFRSSSPKNRHPSSKIPNGVPRSGPQRAQEVLLLDLFHYLQCTDIMTWIVVVVVQSLSPVWLFATQWIAAHQASLSFTLFLSLLKTHVHWISDAIQPAHPLSSPSPAFNLSQHPGLLQWASSSHQVAKVLEYKRLLWKTIWQ